MTDKTRLQHLKMLAEIDFEAACRWAEYNMDEVGVFFETWAKHCGAPKDVFIGHTVKMLISLDT